MNTGIKICMMSALLLVGCDLEEAERMDLTRSSVDSIAPVFAGARFNGSSTVSLRGLYEAIQANAATAPWSVEWSDLGTRWSEAPHYRLIAMLDGQALFERVSSYGDGFHMYVDPGEWMNDAERIQFELKFLDEASMSYVPSGLDPDLRIVDDRPRLEWVSSLEKDSTVRKGDTLEVRLRNPNGDSLQAFSDHVGVRIVGDHVVDLAPGASGRLRWVVTTDAGKDAWIDLQWGTWGASHRFAFHCE